jgi:hypothetical protein
MTVDQRETFADPAAIGWPATKVAGPVPYCASLPSRVPSAASGEITTEQAQAELYEIIVAMVDRSCRPG